MKKIEILSLMDVEFKFNRFSQNQMAKIAGYSGESAHLEKFSDSFSWVFTSRQDTDNSLNGTCRFGLNAIAQEFGFEDASLLIAEDFGVGVLCLQHKADDIEDLNEATERKKETNHECWHYAPLIMQKLGFKNSEFEIERQYPLIGIELAASTLDDFLDSQENKLKLATLYTGNYEFESDAVLLKYLESADLSHRMYERFYLRWTDAVSLYDEGVGDDFERAFYRCVLLYETCVLVRRILESGIKRMDDLSSKMTLIPHPFAFNNLTESMAHVRAALVNAPPVQSDEAKRLLADAYDHFGIRPLADASAERSKLLESRFQWSKSQVLAVLAVVTYLFEKLGLFDFLKRHI